MAKMTWEDFLKKLDEINPLAEKKNWFESYGYYISFSEFPNIVWRFCKNGDIVIIDHEHETEIKVGNYDFEDMIEKIKVWFI